VFQDPDSDGPSESDPFAEQAIDLSSGPPTEPLVITLKAGGRGQAAGPGGGGGGGGGPAGAPSPPPEGLTLPDGPTVTVSGTVTTSRDLPVILDFFHADGLGEGGRAYLGKRKIAAGDFTQAFPVGYGAVEIEAYQDLTGDSRTGDDPAARLEHALVIGQDDVSGVVLSIP
jgi:hypothetical protein